MRDRALILDIDGTLVDSNYQHVIAWQRALRFHDVEVQAWRIHRSIGMGGDQLVANVAGDGVERELGDAIRDAEKAAFNELMPEVAVFPGANELILTASSRGFDVVLASSAKREEAEHYVSLLGAEGSIAGFTTAADVSATKPEPDLIRAALEKADGSRAADSVMVGDSVWDVEAANRAGLETIGVLAGGFSRDELERAGARVVLEGIGQVYDELTS